MTDAPLRESNEVTFSLVGLSRSKVSVVEISIVLMGYTYIQLILHLLLVVLSVRYFCYILDLRWTSLVRYVFLYLILVLICLLSLWLGSSVVHHRDSLRCYAQKPEIQQNM